MRGRRLLIMLAVAGIPFALSAASSSGNDAGGYFETVLAGAPSGYWRLGEDPSATVAADSSGRGHAGAYGFWVNQGVSGALRADPDSAVNLPGVIGGSAADREITVTDAAGLDFGTGDFTVETWFRTSVATVGAKNFAYGVQGDRPLVTKSQGIEPFCRPNPMPSDFRELSGPGWSLTIANEFGLEGMVRAASASTTSINDIGCPETDDLVALGPPVRVDDGAWHHVVAVFDRDSGTTVYVDKIAKTTSGATAWNVSNANMLRLGGLSGLSPLAGDLDETAVYARALTAAEVAAHYDAAQREPADSPPPHDDIDTVGVVRPSGSSFSWSLTDDLVNTNEAFTTAVGNAVVAGDWEGDGVDTAGVISGNRWALTGGNDEFVDIDLAFGLAGDTFFVGDWDGDGIDTPGVRRGTTWYLSNGFAGAVDHSFSMGEPSDQAVVGDWNGDGRDTVGVRRGRTWYLANSLGGPPDATFDFGEPGDAAFAGDWNGDTTDTPGVRRGGTWYLSNDLSGATHRQFAFGDPGDLVVVGNWVVDEGEDVEEILDSPPSASSLQPSAASTPAVVERYAPVLILNEDYTGDWYNPSSVYYYFLRRSSLWWAVEDDDNRLVRRRGPAKKGVRACRLGVNFCPDGARPYTHPSPNNSANEMRRFSATDLTRLREEGAGRRGLSTKEGFYLDLAQGAKSGQRDLTEVPSYYEYRPQRWIVYWYFYPFSEGKGTLPGQNPSIGNHEGDWERIAIRLNGANEAGAVRLYRHQDRCNGDTQWQSLRPDEFIAGRRMIFVARGSHGNYATPGDEGDLCGDDATSETGARWRTWLRLGNVRSQSWYGFGGAWGQVDEGPTQGADFETGPLGPSRYRRPVPADW